MPFPNPDTQFKPGNSGNPKGGNRKRTVRRLLKQWLRDVSNTPVPADLLDTIPPELRAMAGEALIGEVLAHQLIRRALKGSHKDLELLLSTEPKELKIDVPDKPTAELNVQPKRLDEVTEILGESDTLH